MFDGLIDQASGLRRLFAARETQVVTVVADARLRDEAVMQLARALAAQGKRVALVDENNAIAWQCGLRAKYELGHWLSGSATPQEVVLHAEERIVIVPAARGLARLRAESAPPAERIGELLARAGHKSDVVICSAGCADERRTQIGFAGEGELLLVVGARADDITAAYGQLKLLVRTLHIRSARVLVARAKSEQAARATFDAMAHTARRFLGVDLEFCGFLPGAQSLRDGAGGHLLQRIGERLTDTRVSAFAPAMTAPAMRSAVG